mgnify:CR=1 FL=1
MTLGMELCFEKRQCCAFLQMCDAVEAASSADSLQELVSSVVTAVSATLTYELHVDLGVRLALLPCKESPTGVLFYSTAPAAAGCAGEAASGAVPQSPMGKLGGRAPPTASVSMTNLAMRQQLVPPGHQPSLHSHFDPGPMVVAESAAAAAALLPATSMPTDFVRTSAPGTSGAPALAAPAGAGDVIPSKGTRANRRRKDGCNLAAATCRAEGRPRSRSGFDGP